MKRPIINTRDEPHATAEKYRRLHVIVGDATMCEVATLLKVGTTSLVLAMLEAGALEGGPAGDLRLAEPVRALHEVSHDPGLTQLRPPARRAPDDGACSCSGPTWRPRTPSSPTATAPTSTPTPPRSSPRWEQVLDQAGDRRVLRRPRAGLGREAAAAGGLPLPRRAGLGPRAAAGGGPAVVRHAPGEGPLPQARRSAARSSGSLDPAGRRPRRGRTRPTDTRAYFRGECLARYGPRVAAASWDSVIFDVAGRGALQRVPTLEPLRGTREHVGALLDRCDDRGGARGRPHRRADAARRTAPGPAPAQASRGG